MWFQRCLVFVDSCVRPYPGSGLIVSRNWKPVFLVSKSKTSFPVWHNGRKSLSENNGV